MPNDLVVDESDRSSLVGLVEELRTRLDQESGNTELLQEQIAELELALEDVGWLRMTAFGDREFSIAGLRRLRRLSRMSYLKNPLIHNAVETQANYVWGQGFSISAGSEEVNQVIQAFLDDPKNVKSFTGQSARLSCERMLRIEGERFFVLFTNEKTGRVVVRTIYPDEIEDVISSPQDYQEPRFYKRVWVEETFDNESGIGKAQTRTGYYPDWHYTYQTLDRPSHIAGAPVFWDAPIYHVKTGGFDDMKRGVPEIYSALDWARAVKEDLEAYATQKQALARFAWQMKTRGGKSGVAAGKSRLGSTPNIDGAGQLETNPPPVTGATFIGAQGWEMNPIKLAGTTISPEEGARMWNMVSAGTGIPETILAGNAGAGNMATAKTLDRPTELQMANRQKLWADIYTDILNYVVDKAALAPKNTVIHGEMVSDGEEGSVEIDGDVDRSITVRFPSILLRDPLPIVQAIVQATTLAGGQSAGLLDDQTVTALLLTALSQEDVDESLMEIYGNNDVKTFLAGKGLNGGVQGVHQAIQSLIDDTGDMGDAITQGQMITSPAPTPAGSDLGLGMIASDRDLPVLSALRAFEHALQRSSGRVKLSGRESSVREVSKPQSSTRSGVKVRTRRPAA